MLTFSEAPDVKLSLVRVVDASGAAVPGVSAPQAVPGDPLSLQVTPSQPLADGVYTVNWRAVSAVDGHVRVRRLRLRRRPEARARQRRGGRPAAHLAVGQRARRRGALAAVRRPRRCWSAPPRRASSSTAGRLPAGGVIVLALRRRRRRRSVSPAMVWAEKVLVGAPSLLPLFLTRRGAATCSPSASPSLICIGAVVARRPLAGALEPVAARRRGRRGRSSSTSPPATPRRRRRSWLLNIVVQWVHMTADRRLGRRPLLAAARASAAGTSGARAAAVGVFTRIATAVLVVVLVTGLARALVEVGSVSALFDTSYGITLLVKVGLVAGLVALGALNHFFWVPAVRDGGGEVADRRFGLNSRGELAVGARACWRRRPCSAGWRPPPRPSRRIGAGCEPAGAGHRLRPRLRDHGARRADAHAGGRRAQRLQALGRRLRHRRPAADGDRRAPGVLAAGAPVRGRRHGAAATRRRRQLDRAAASSSPSPAAGQVDVVVEEEARGVTVPLELTIPAGPARLSRAAVSTSRRAGRRRRRARRGSAGLEGEEGP